MKVGKANQIASSPRRVVCGAIGLETGSAVQDYIGLRGGAPKLLSENLECVERAAIEILNAMGAADSSGRPA